MNRLKYVFGLNVSCQVPSSAASVTRSHPKELCKRRISKPRLLKSDRPMSSKEKRIYDLNRELQCADHKGGTAQQRNKTKPTVISSKILPLERNSSMDYAVKHSRRYSTNQITKYGGNKRHVGRNNESAKDLKDVGHNRAYGTKRITSAHEKEPRSYAQIIASYTEAMYRQPNPGMFGESVSSGLQNGVRRSPFSTFSVISLKKKNIDGSLRNSCFRASSCKLFGQGIRFRSESSNIRNSYLDPEMKIKSIENMGKDMERTNSSYATMIARYSNAIMFDNNCHNRNDTTVPKRNVSTSDFENLPMMFLSPKNVGTTDITNTVPKIENKITTSFPETTHSTSTTTAQKEVDWVSTVEDIIKDLKKVTAKRDASGANQTDEKCILQSVNEHALWLDRVVKAHKKKYRGEATIQETPGITNTITNMNANEKIEELSTVSNIDTEQISASNKKSNSIIQYGKRGQAASNTTVKNTSQTPTTTIAKNTNKTPQVELHMTPSQNESVVSINVDKLVSKLDNVNTNAEELSVTVCSNKMKNAVGMVQQSNVNMQQNPQSNFDSMEISISENSVPIKQIEFSINGKPVQELKSFIAKAEKLDVVTSQDKVEIRIPFTQDNVQSKQQLKPVVNSMTNQPQMLNLQISAKFNEHNMRNTTPTNVVKHTPKSVPIPTPPGLPKPQYAGGKKAETTTKTTLNDTTSEKPSVVTATNVKNSEQVKEVDNGAWRQKARTINESLKTETAKPSVNINNIDAKTAWEKRKPTHTPFWWTSQETLNVIKRKEDVPKSAPPNVYGVQQKVSPRKESGNVKQEPDKTNQKQRQASSSPTTSTNQRDSMTTLKPWKNEENNLTKKLTSKENDKKSLELNTANKSPRTQSSQRILPIKPVSSDTRVSRSVTEKKTTSIDSIFPKKKEYKYSKSDTTVSPKSEVTKSTSKMEVRNTSSSPSINVNYQKGRQSLKVSDSKTASKGVNNPKKPVTISADSVTTPRSAKQEMTKASEDKLIAKKGQTKRVPTTDPRIKEILETMKPIEKKEDGTLIDYGVTVPSRKKPEKHGKVSKLRNKTAVNVELKEIIPETPSHIKAKEDRGKFPKSTKTSMRKKSGATNINKRAVQATIKKDTDKSATKNTADKRCPASKDCSMVSLKKSSSHPNKDNPVKTTEKQETKVTSSSGSSRSSKPTNFVTAKMTPSPTSLTTGSTSTSLRNDEIKASILSGPFPIEKFEKSRLRGTVMPSPSPEPEKQDGVKKSWRPSSMPNLNNPVKLQQIEKVPQEGKKALPLANTVPNPSLQSSVKVPVKQRTDAAPLQGTIISLPKKTQNVMSAVVQSIKGKLSGDHASPDAKRKGCLPKSSASNTSFNKGRGNPEPCGSSNIHTGPGGRNTGIPGTCKTAKGDVNGSVVLSLACSLPKKRMISKDFGVTNDGVEELWHVKTANEDESRTTIPLNGTTQDSVKNEGSLVFNSVKRPEKELLYSVWLQRENGIKEGN